MKKLVAVGFCKNWNEKGFGFVELLEGADKGKTVFLHYRVMHSYYNKYLKPGEICQVEYMQGEKGLQATDCWSTVYGYTLGSNQRLEEKIKGIIFNVFKFPTDEMFFYKKLNTVEEYKEKISEEEALKRNIEIISSYKKEYHTLKGSTVVTYVELEEGDKRWIYSEDEKTEQELVLINPFSLKFIYRQHYYAEYNK